MEVKADETTLLEPGLLTVKHAALQGNRILEPETGQEVGQVSNSKSSIALLPGEYEVTFGQALWPIKLEAGQRLVLNPGVVALKGAKITGHKLYDAQGREEFELKEGQRLELKV